MPNRHARGAPPLYSSPRDKVPHPGSSIAWGRWAITCNDPSFCGQGAPDSGEDYGPAPGGWLAQSSLLV